jgi:hypothetical protein
VASLRACQLIRVEEATLRIDGTHTDLAELLTDLHRKYALLRFARRTELGDVVVSHFRQELENRGSIRWAPKLEEITADTLARCPYR